MPMDSYQISALTGSFNQQVMMGMQHSAMISQMYGGFAPNTNTQPVPTPGQQFAGMAMGAFGNMGMNALGSDRLNNFGGGMLSPFAQGGQYMVGQVMYGAQQQQMLEANLRQSYRFQNEFGGRGFTQNQMSGIGSDLRSLSMMRGPGGETTSFEELGRLASNMGRMGMAEGVRSVKDFNEKFRQMLTTVKTIAEELGTSLEEAQKVMASLKGSGIFTNQGTVAGMMRKGAVAGNLGMSEVSGMALIGSQISRAVGGLGSSGAMAGINAISNIGAAQQAGVLNESDIYNVTGLTGAEGRRAFAQQNLSADAAFFRGGLGRRMLAGMTGLNGKLDMTDVQAFMTGTVGTGETMQRAQQNLSGVGRANFIRNEGRLRGEALSQFGGLGRGFAAMGWLQSHGMDLDESNDRSMLFFQRRFHLGRDEADQVVRMARNRDRIEAQKRQSDENDQYARMLERSERQQSPQEVLRQIEMGRQGVQNRIRQFGAEAYEDLSVNINEAMGRLTGGYFDRRRTDLSGAISQVYHGGRDARSTLEREFGLTVGANGAIQTRTFGGAAVKAAQRELFGTGELSQSQFNRFLGGQLDAIRGAGYEAGDIRSQGDYANMVLESHRRKVGFMEGGSEFLRGGGRPGGVKLDEDTRKELRGLFAVEGVQGKDRDALSSIEKTFEKIQTKQGKELAQAFVKATDEERARIFKDVTTQLGLEKLGSGRFGGADQFASLAIGGGKNATRAMEMQNIGAGLTVGLTPGGFEKWGEGLGNLGEKLQMALGGNATGAGRFIGRWVGRGGTLTNMVGRADAFRENLANNREAAADVLASTPGDMLKGTVGLVGRGLDKLTGGRASDYVHGLVGGSVSGKGGAIDKLLGATGLQDFFKGQATKLVGGYSDTQKRAMGEYLSGREGRSTLQGYLSSNEEVRAATQEESEKRRAELAGKDQRSVAEEAEYRGLQGIQAASEVEEMRRNKEELTEEKLTGIAKRVYGKEGTAQTVYAAYKDVGASFNKQQEDARRQMAQGMGIRARREEEDVARTREDVEKLRKEGKFHGATEGFMSIIGQRRRMMAQLTGAEGAGKEDARLFQDIQNFGEQEVGFRRRLLAGGVKGAQNIADELMSTGRGEEMYQGSLLRREASIEQRLDRSGKRGSAREAGVIASMFGAHFQKGELGKSTSEQVSQISQKLGLDLLGGEGVEARKELQSILSGEGMNKIERAQRIRAFQDRGELSTGKQAQQDMQAKMDDPSYRALDAIKQHMEKTAKSTESMARNISNLPENLATVMKDMEKGGE